MADLMKLKTDMHAHTKYSEHPSEWVLQKLGTKESYTEPEDLYRKAVENGMDFVVITDHNRIEGAKYLVSKYPEKCFMGVELTAYFPEDGCKLHILVYDFTEEQFEQLDLLRKDVYKLREYIKLNNFPYSVAHATYSVNNKLTITHIEKLILLFDVFETINGGRNLYSNNIWFETLKNITPDIISKLRKKYDIEPFSDTPWIKSFTGGSDDHAGILNGKTYTFVEYDNCTKPDKKYFLDMMRSKKSEACGRHNEFYTLSFSIYKIAWDFIRNSRNEKEKNIFSYLNELIFTNENNLTFKKKLIVKHLKSKYKKRNDVTKSILIEFIEKFQKPELEIEVKIEYMYEMLTKITDQYFSALINSLIKDLKKLDLINVFQKISASFLGVVITLPFISTLKHMYENRQLLDDLKNNYIKDEKGSKNKVVWFTDTINDLNGVSVTLKKIAELANVKGNNLTLVGALKSDDKSELPAGFMNLESILEFTPKEYENYTFHFPSIMKTIKQIYELHPDSIIISTPGPVGLTGLLCAKLLNIKTKAIYHTDFTLEFEKIIGENSPSHIVEGFMKWFYEQNDKILVPSSEYISILSERGYDSSKMEIFRRGLDLRQFYPKPESEVFIKNFYNLEEGINLLFTGRVSKDKNIDFLLEVFEMLQATKDKYNLIITGDGPYLAELKKRTRNTSRIIYTGKVKQQFLPYLYSGADLFLFPSTTDTFGMSVLESQACGLVSIVSTNGGPKEIIKDGETGFALPVKHPEEWCRKIIELVELKKEKADEFKKLKKNAVKNVEKNYDWDKILQFILT